MNVVMVADGPLVAEQGAAWHTAVESSHALAKALGPGNFTEFPEHPGDRVLFPLVPSVVVDDKQLPILKENVAQIAGIDPPWQAWWRFVLPDHPRTDARLLIFIPKLDRGIDNPVYAGSLREVLISH
ncbi:hypothetical protein BKA23_2163 [Rudaeicoccus suwonensis]|uniref:Uncharacterized protein n=2 Tax=Rudaeicoccus suwonensis TaxID=657409 RepID=A0A561ECK0_9MICO|nr:hypothetical protein BKA23_2163 [Rudaeicoccus suwonensis]